MITALVRHLYKQEKYKPGEIAVLTPYVEQLKILRDLLGKVAELIIGKRDLMDLDDIEVKVDVSNSGGKRMKQRP